MALLKAFEVDEDVMEVDSHSQSLKKLLVDKAKNQPKGATSGKRTRDRVGTSPSSTPQQRQSPRIAAQGPELISKQKLKLWLGFEAMEKLAAEQGLDELFTDKTIADRVTRGIPRKEVEELENVSISYPQSAADTLS